MVNQEIFSGLASALIRGESLKRAMMTFYNAGYKKEEIEEAAIALRSQSSGGFQGPTLQKTPNVMYPEQKKPLQKPETKATPPSTQQIPSTSLPQEKKVKKSLQKKPIKKKTKQIISNYGPQPNNTEVKKNIDQAIYYLKKINVPSKMKRTKNINKIQAPLKVQKVSDYKGGPVKPFNKSLTIFLVILLILLLGGLIAALFFREQLIEIFNNFNFN